MRETTLAIQEQKNRTKQRRERRQETKESFHITSSVNRQLRRIRLTNTAGLPADTCGPSGTHAQMRLILHCIRVQSRSEILGAAQYPFWKKTCETAKSFTECGPIRSTPWAQRSNCPLNEIPDLRTPRVTWMDLGIKFIQVRET